jgi:hypothetical protein
MVFFKAVPSTVDTASLPLLACFKTALKLQLWYVAEHYQCFLSNLFCAVKMLPFQFGFHFWKQKTV